MNIKGVNNTQVSAVPQKNFSLVKANAQSVSGVAQPQDIYERSQIIEHYDNYSNIGATDAQKKTEQNTTPDITADYFWDDPRWQQRIDYLEKVFGQRAQESMRTSDSRHHAWQRYFDPSASHFVGHDLNDWERRMAFNNELAAIGFFERGGTGFMGIRGVGVDPIFEGRGLGGGDPHVPQIDQINSDRRSATERWFARNNVARQLSELLNRNGILIPDNLKLRFTIDSDYNLRVEGTDDKNLIRQIEYLLNRNGNSEQLFTHIFQSRQPGSTQFPEDSYRMSRLETAIRELTGLNLRTDLTLAADGRFLTEDGTNILDILWDMEANPHFAAFILNELVWLAEQGGVDNIPELTLSIDFMNGHLFDVGQENGFGPGQTGWIDELPGTDAPGVREYA